MFTCPIQRRWGFGIGRNVCGTACGLFLLLAAGGCRLWRTAEPLRFTVQSPALDTLEVLYVPDPAMTGIEGAPVRMTLLGSGHVHLRRGHSPRVVNSFSSATRHPQWHDYREDQLSVSMDEMREVFQRLVDLGLVPASRHARPASVEPTFPLVRVSGRIQGHRVHRAVFEPDLVRTVESILQSVSPTPAPAPRPSSPP